MSEFGLFSWLTKRRSHLRPKVALDFQCRVCQRKFRRKLSRLFIELNTYDQRQLGQTRPKRSEFIIPERIACPKCKTVDQYRLASPLRSINRSPKFL